MKAFENKMISIYFILKKTNFVEKDKPLFVYKKSMQILLLIKLFWLEKKINTCKFDIFFLWFRSK